MDPILDLARAHGWKVIEDNAQAFGATYRGRKTGSIGDIGCLSFFPTKNLGAYGDGGMVVTSNAALAERIRMLRTHGWKKKYYSEELGYNSRLDALQASILQAKFMHVDAWNDKRRELARRYTDHFAPLGIQVPVECDWGKHVYHLYNIRSDRRPELQAFLKERGVASEVYYPLPPHLSTPCRKFGYREGDLPHAERASHETLALPLYPELSLTQQDQVIQAVCAFVG
jgi:dTDP-4-amino-4,6-dideoxygalactose transaminase